MENTKKFADGLRVNKPRESAPDFVIAKLGIKVDVFTKYLEEHANANGYVDLDVLKSKDGNSYYATLNDWKPDGEQKTPQEPAKEDINPDEIPF